MRSSLAVVVFFTVKSESKMIAWDQFCSRWYEGKYFSDIHLYSCTFWIEKWVNVWNLKCKSNIRPILTIYSVDSQHIKSVLLGVDLTFQMRSRRTTRSWPCFTTQTRYGLHTPIHRVIIYPKMSGGLQGPHFSKSRGPAQKVGAMQQMHVLVAL